MEFWDRFPFIVPLDRLVGAGESRFEDIFDPDFKARLRKKISGACAKTKDHPRCIGYFKCQYVDQVLPTGMLKQGLHKSDGTVYEEFAGLLTQVHQRLIEQLQ